MEYQLNVRKVLDALLKQAWIILGTGVVTLLLGFLLVSGDGPDAYAASSTIYAASYASYQETVQGMNIMRDYVDVVRSRKVAERAAGYLSQSVSAGEIMGMVSAQYVSDSKILRITTTSSNPQVSVAVANAVADAFIQEIVSITATESVKVLDSAYAAGRVASAKSEAMQTRLTLTAAALFIAICMTAVTAMLDTRVMGPKEVTLNGEIELFGIIPNKDI